jgi:uncharacterized protein (TIGR03067 family)
MRRSLLFLVALVWVSGCKSSGTTGDESREPTDMGLLRGSWAAEYYESDGKPVTPGVLRSTRIDIEGDALEMFESKNQEHGILVTFKLDPEQTPKHIDMRIASGAESGMIALGIYRLDGEVLRICCAAPGQPRPSAFTTVNGSARANLVLTKIRDVD